MAVFSRIAMTLIGIKTVRGALRYKVAVRLVANNRRNGPGNLPLTCTSPKNLFTSDFQANQCSGQTNDGTGYVELTVTLNAEVLSLRRLHGERLYSSSAVVINPTPFL